MAGVGSQSWKAGEGQEQKQKCSGRSGKSSRFLREDAARSPVLVSQEYGCYVDWTGGHLSNGKMASSNVGAFGGGTLVACSIFDVQPYHPTNA